MKIYFIIIFLFLTLSSNAQTGIITTIAGNGTSGDSGDGGVASLATITGAGGGIFDVFGNFYFTEGGGNRIRKITPSGIIKAVAGTGAVGFYGDGGPATAAKLRFPKYIATDSVGNLYIADVANSRIRKVNAITGIITTVAGDGTVGYGGDGLPATNAQIAAPVGLCIDKHGNMYIGDQTFNIIRRIDAVTGIISTIAGTPGVSSYSGDGGPATAAELVSIEAMCSDKHGNVYVINADKVRKIDIVTGVISTFAGNGSTGYGGDGIPATSTSLNTPFAICFDDSGSLFIADTQNDRIRKIDTFGIIRTVVGNGVGGFSGDGGMADTAKINWPEGVAFDSCGNLFFNDLQNYRIRKVIFDTGCDISHGTLNTKQVVFPNIYLYPNPTTDILHVENIKPGTIYQLTNIMGMVIQRGILENYSCSISVTLLPSGVYSILLTDDIGNRTIKKIIKQ
jgi:Secretion system C-terminal sorting domain